MTDDDGNIIQDITSYNGKLAYSRELESGYYTAEISLNGYITGYENVAVSSVYSRNPDVVTSLLCPELKANECRIILEWGANPSDLDSHLKGAGMHIYYNSPSYLNIANLDVDDTSSYGPETITLFTEKDGTYTYSVHDYTNRDSKSSKALSNSSAKVKFYYNIGGKEQLVEYVVPSGKSGNVWKVFSFVVSNGAIDVSSINELNVFTNQSNPLRV